MTTRAVSGAFVVAVSFTPPTVNSEVTQGALVVLARVFPNNRGIEISPAVDLPCIASCGSVPHFWRQA